MQGTIAATLLQYKAEYFGTITLRQPRIIAWSFQIAAKHNLWLPPTDAFVKLNIPAVINLSGEMSEALTRELQLI
jgi:hypothetical protein